MTEEFRRTLAAVLCADVAGYTQLMSGDESGTHAAYKACLADVVHPALSRHRGRLVKSTGDGFIAVFDSVVEAVACAVAIQKDLTEPERTNSLTFRIGVNVGDVIVEDDDVFGEGVNMAQRMETLAAHGGVCVSALVREQVQGKLNVEFQDLGRVRVKGYEGRQRAFAVRIDTAKPTFMSRMRPGLFPAGRRVKAIGIVAIAVLAASVVISDADLMSMRRLAGFVNGSEETHLPLPDRPSLVVLPFRSIGTASDQDYFADGMTEDLITELSRIPGLFVIANKSSFEFKAKDWDVRKVGRDLGVRYALEGSVRRANEKVRIVAQLIDAKDGKHLWAGRFDRPLGDIFGIQDEITDKIVTALAVNIEEIGKTRRPGTQTNSIAAYDAYLRGWAAYRRNTLAEYEKAIEYFQAAINLDPGYAQAHAAIASTYLTMRQYAWTRSESFDSRIEVVLDSRRRTEEFIDKARYHIGQAMRNPTSLAYRASAEVSIFEHRHDQALTEIREAIALDPNDADNFAMLSAILVWAGNAESAIEPIERAIRLNPYHPPIYYCHYGSALFSQARYAEAKEKLEACRTGNPENSWPYIYLIATYAYLDETGKAADALAGASELMRHQNRSLFTVREVGSRMRYRYRADLMRLLVGLHKANVRPSEF